MKKGVTVKFTTIINGPFTNEYSLMHITVPAVENLI